ncbi:MAG: NAD-dependent epimerase/dehydratase family protein [Desulfobacterales bacterium]|jgi:nucleoside-diphosphate-sugar epimerase|nr:NAD-dependent epimerase/dehydratase family protein [Desulfobacterales bacterium]
MPMPPHAPETALVTGGGGFLGSAVARRLAARGDRVISFSRAEHPRLARLGVAHIRGDIADGDALARACRGVDVVHHTAAKPPPWGPPDEYRRTNVTGTANVIAACRRCGVQRLIHTSTPSVLFDGRDLEGVDESAPYPARWHSPYAETKALAEQQVLRAAAGGLPAVVLRPHEIWGPHDPHFVPRILARAHRLRRIGDGKNLVDTTYIDNAAAAHLLAADRLRQAPGLSGRVYFISQGEPIPAWDMIDAILRAAGRGPVKGRISHRSAWLIGWACELIYSGLRLSGDPPLTRFVADALARAHWFDISAARRDLGYAPAVSTAEGLRRLAAWLKPNGKDPT